MKLKKSCCDKYRRKAKACNGCPVFSVLSKQKRKRKLAKIGKSLKKAA